MSWSIPFKLKGQLANGRYGSIYRANRENGEEIVVKQVDLISLKKDDKLLVQKEVEINKDLKSPFIVRFFESFTGGGYMYIALEYCDSGDLSGLIRSHHQQGASFAQNILQGLSLMHSLHIIHRDIKPENILMQSEGGQTVCKIGDFGLSWRLKGSDDYCTTFTGTPIYMAPEVIQGYNYNEKVDLWSLGCVVVELCNLEQPYNHEDLQEVMTRVLQSSIPQVAPGYTHDMTKLVGELLVKNPRDRRTADEILDNRLFVKCKPRSEGPERRTELSRCDPRLTPSPVRAQSLLPVASSPVAPPPLSESNQAQDSSQRIAAAISLRWDQFSLSPGETVHKPSQRTHTPFSIEDSSAVSASIRESRQPPNSNLVTPIKKHTPQPSAIIRRISASQKAPTAPLLSRYLPKSLIPAVNHQPKSPHLNCKRSSFLVDPGYKRSTSAVPFSTSSAVSRRKNTIGSTAPKALYNTLSRIQGTPLRSKLKTVSLTSRSHQIGLAPNSRLSRPDRSSATSGNRSIIANRTVNRAERPLVRRPLTVRYPSKQSTAASLSSSNSSFVSRPKRSISQSKSTAASAGRSKHPLPLPPPSPPTLPRTPPRPSPIPMCFPTKSNPLPSSAMPPASSPPSQLSPGVSKYLCQASARAHAVTKSEGSASHLRREQENGHTLFLYRPRRKEQRPNAL